MFRCKQIWLFFAIIMLPLLIHLTIVSHNAVQTYLAYAYPQILLESDHQHVEGNKIHRLQQLQKIPIIELIRSLIVRQNWEQAILHSKNILDSIYYRNCFQIWYLKAKAECLSLKLEECRNSAYKAYLLTDKTYQRFKIGKLFQVFSFKCKRCEQNQLKQLQIL